MEFRILTEHWTEHSGPLGLPVKESSEPRLQIGKPVTRYRDGEGGAEPYLTIDWIDVPAVHVDI